MLGKHLGALGEIARPLAEIRPPFAGQRGIDVDLVDGIEEGVQTVIVPLRYRVVLVVVTLGAFDAQAEPYRRHGIRAVDRFLEAGLFEIDPALAVLEGVAVEARGDARLHRAALEQVAGNLFEGKPIERHVMVQRVNDPMAEAPGVRTGQVFFIAVAVGVAGLIEPMLGPLLAVMPRVQQAIHQLFVGVRAIIEQKALDLLGRGRKTRQVEAEPADQRGLAGGRRRLDAFGIEFCEHETIDGIADPPRVAYPRKARAGHRLKAPMPRLRVFGFGGCRIRGIRPCNALVDPSPQQADLSGCEPLADRRHHDLAIGARHQLDQAAFAALAR